MNEIRVERMLRELRCDPATQMCERVLAYRPARRRDSGATFRTFLFIVVLCLGIAVNVAG